MRQSKLFTKTRKEAPADEIAKNAELLTRAGFINKQMAGVYALLPLGLRVMKKIENIIREEMNTIGSQEISMTTLQDPEVWKKTDRWSDEAVDVWFKTKLKNDTELGLGCTHEEPITKMLTEHLSSYRDLPFSVYQIQTKFRNEPRAKSGILRGREFLMKDMYSFCSDEDSHNEFYEKSKIAYKNVFQRLGIGHLTYITFASGGMFSKYSHEFQTICPVGEDTIYLDEEKGIAVNKEVFDDEVLSSLGLDKSKMVEHKAIEVGNIFTLGKKYSEPLGLTFKNESSEDLSVFMGCYGIGIGRLMGTVVEALSDDKGIIWPESIAPFKFHLLALGESENVKKEANSLYDLLLSKGVEVFFDDREAMSAGEKFADSDLIGIPYRIVVSERSLKEGGFELKKRTEEKGKIVSQEELLKII
ncbi:MAG: prolyl-tRNA synthetase [Candidatus Pacebacteria bacterium]|nr:prolyl-tRNA synthetase [Candidatus Paceibacterota bacterium]MCF7862975.1 prolyl-tRNA synthetase [Candidatus Paceibacterota bacterium]